MFSHPVKFFSVVQPHWFFQLYSVQEGVLHKLSLFLPFSLTDCRYWWETGSTKIALSFYGIFLLMAISRQGLQPHTRLLLLSGCLCVMFFVSIILFSDVLLLGLWYSEGGSLFCLSSGVSLKLRRWRFVLRWLSRCFFSFLCYEVTRGSTAEHLLCLCHSLSLKRGTEVKWGILSFCSFSYKNVGSFS